MQQNFVQGVLTLIIYNKYTPYQTGRLVEGRVHHCDGWWRNNGTREQDGLPPEVAGSPSAQSLQRVSVQQGQQAAAAKTSTI